MIKVSENDNVTAQALQKLQQMSWEWVPEEESLQATLENRHRRCRRDVLGQTVPGTSSSDRKGPVADGG